MDALTLSADTWLSKPTTPRAKRSRWWRPACSQAVSALRHARGDNHAKRHLQHALTAEIRAAKRDWADKALQEQDIWDVAKWRLGRRLSIIPALHSSEGPLLWDRPSMETVLAARFFGTESSPVQLNFVDDPPPLPTRPFAPLSEAEIHALLRKTSSNSAPGLSKISWKLLKLAWESIDTHVTFLFNASLSHSFVPPRWKRALTVVLPKPNRPDYTLAKAHRPISLLETLAKLLEKCVAKRLTYDIDTYGTLSSAQFGARAHSCCLDSALSLVHDVTQVQARGFVCGMVLFDVSGFFDNVHPDRCTRIIERLGHHPSLTGWIHSFLTGRSASLSFNGHTGPPIPLHIGTPQGSPLSPVLSTLYTSPLLALAQSWVGCKLSMYVDDGLLFAWGPSWDHITASLDRHFRIVLDWLSRAGMAAEPDKTEALFFSRARKRNLPPAHIYLPDPSHNTYFKVVPGSTVRYLGFYFTKSLSWRPHVQIMCRRARASLQQLSVLGNSSRGISMANWRLVLNAICLPVLAYGSQLWVHSRQATGLIKLLQEVANAMVHRISGSFHTAPRAPLHELVRLLPMRHFIHKLAETTALRLHSLPPASQITKRLQPGADNHFWTGTHRRPPPRLLTPLKALAARTPSLACPVDVLALAPWDFPSWGGRVNLLGVVPPQARKDLVVQLLAQPRSDVALIHSASALGKKGRRDGTTVGASASTLMDSRGEWTMEWCRGTGLTQADLDLFGIAQTMHWLTGFFSADVPPPPSIYFTASSSSSLLRLQSRDPKQFNSDFILFQRSLLTFLSSFPGTCLTLMWVPAMKDYRAALVSAKAADHSRVSTPSDALDERPSPAKWKSLSRLRAFSNWRKEWLRSRAANTPTTTHPDRRDNHAYSLSIHPTYDAPSGHNHPLWSAATKPRGVDEKPYTRLTTSTAMRLATGHAFIAEYTERFHPKKPPLARLCTCDDSTPATFPHILLHCPLYSVSRHTLQFLPDWALEQDPVDGSGSQDVQIGQA